MKYIVELNNCGNIDHNQDPFCPVEGTLTGSVHVESLEEAVIACREYIELNDLGGGNWIGGQVYDFVTLKQVASISYNGRVWEPNSDNEIMVDDTIIAEALKKDTYYHVTPLSNIASIYNVGLIPLIGGRATKLEEPEPAVYLFKSLADCEDALTNWLGDEFNDDETLAIIDVKLPRCFKVESSTADYEVLVKQPIPINYLIRFQLINNQQVENKK